MPIVTKGILLQRVKDKRQWDTWFRFSDCFSSLSLTSVLYELADGSRQDEVQCG